MEKPISKGDLVEVVGSCCGITAHFLGRFYTAGAPTTRAARCPYCKVVDTGPGFTFEEIGGDYKCPTRFLKRIPPLEELEDEKRDETVSA